MANTYTQLNIHAVFATLGRENVLPKNLRPRIFEYITGLIKGVGSYPLAVNGYQDHVHVFFEIPPDISVSKALQEIKANSSGWLNTSKLLPGRFLWQSGFGAFSYSRSQRNEVIQYILNQEVHHQKKTFKEEYLSYLQKFEIEYNTEYLFEFYE